MKSKIAVCLYLIISVYVFFNREGYKEVTPFQVDASGYYLFLPATLIYHDLDKFGFYHDVNKTYNLSGDYDHYGMVTQPDNRQTDRYAIGTCFFELPAFLIAHAYCNIDHTYPDDGYSYPFVFAGYLGCMVWVAVGLYILSLFLKRFFSDNVTAVVILCLGFGTNLYYYTVFRPAFSHPYSFVAFCFVLYLTEKWYRTLRFKYLGWLGIMLGFVIILRPVNIVVVLVPLLWQVNNLQTFKERFVLFSQKKAQLLAATVLYFAIATIQMGYWKHSAGHWIYYSYQGEHFNFLKPKILKGLFSYRKGWFVYTPVAFLGFWGFFALWKKDKRLVPSLLIFFAIILYIVFSWEQWWYGGGFGCRALIDVLPVLAIPLAALIERTFSLKNVIAKVGLLILLVFFIALNVFQTYQSTLNYIPFDRITGQYYWSIFGKVKFNQDDYEKYLIQDYTADMH